VCKVSANILNKESRAADKGWSSCLGVGRRSDNSSSNNGMLRMILDLIYFEQTHNGEMRNI
jgi:hypothetical protein